MTKAEDVKLTSAIHFAKVKVEILHFKIKHKIYNKTVIDSNFSWHKDLSTLKSDIHLGFRVNIIFSGW